MTTKEETFNQGQLKKDLDNIKPGDTVKVHQKIKDSAKGKERIQIFEGRVIARKHGKGTSSNIIVRRSSSGIGVEKTFPLHSPVVSKIEIIKKGKAKRAKLYYLRTAKGKRAKLKREEMVKANEGNNSN
jgi:large subunit ribosomal protein L19